jgi:hypothetical protein
MTTKAIILAALVLAGCGAQSVEKPIQAKFDAGGRPCRYTEWRQVVTVSCDPPKPGFGDVEVFPPVVAPKDHDDGSMVGVFQDLLDLKIFQPTFIEGSGLTLFGGGG